MQTLVAPTDFSPASRNAVDYAADLASAVGADLLLLYVSPIPLALPSMPYPAYELMDWLAEAEER